ncbi:hypothetical protein IY885_04680 [Campylobacter volucris]|uniref:YopX family protein n=1 Tax=Campylobacter volucris TaxID=1031542 RepID=UPI00189DD52F|nr:YopX family protein [Campylobacter volucris]MBF7067549.1 hypothetical protein [Campylobacter volucris]
MKLKEFDFRIWNGKKYLKQKIYNDNINDNEYIAVTGNVDDENYVFTIEHGCERNYHGGDYDEYCKVKDFISCNYEIELFTGLYDKNGKKIYEGDIIDINADPFIFKDIVCMDMIRGIELKESNYHLCNVIENFTYGDYIDEIEVIGNIHNNHI